MFELIQLSFAPINLPFTIPLILVGGYWSLVIVGGLAADAIDLDLDLDTDADFDLDLDLDADVDVDIDADIDVDADTGNASNALLSATTISILRFLNVVDVPIMIWASTLVLFLWSGAVLATHYLNPSMSLGLAFGLFVPNLIISLIVTKFATAPLGAFYRHVNAGIAAPAKIVGKTCTVTTGEVTPTFGQAEMQQAGAPITLNVRSREGDTLAKGMEALVIEKNDRDNTYLVVPFNLEVK